MESSFAEVVGLIEQARQRAYQAVNSELVGLYWRIGEYISAKLAAAVWGEGVVDSLAQHLARTMPGQRGFTRRNLFRMRQFFEAYSTADKDVTALLTQLPWTHNLIILTQSKRPEERDFYLRLAVQEKWTSRELERQYSLGTFERAVLSPAKVSAALTQMHGAAAGAAFKDAYSVEFLNLQAGHTEADLHSGLLGQLRTFLIELGRDFCFVGSEFPVQVGGRDFALDLLFFHRGLNCLVAIELKVDRFEPEHLGKLNFYLEALDRDVRKPHENPAIGVLLCASKDSEVVEYALSRSLSPALVAQYQTQLPDKQMLAAKLHEFYALNAPGPDIASGSPAGQPLPRKKAPSHDRQSNFHRKIHSGKPVSSPLARG
ncbi:YhcG family protein [Methylibium sp. T29-B]|uniref:PDDEXK nuclease domain-containing protein n=1 Tax=Methylibium sp. T29-B TaxID=1437443 RepID=UPI0004B053E3|nr:PDDEXK nuclease domain-containing protein [Methylibium sp. T29-B]